MIYTIVVLWFLILIVLLLVKYKVYHSNSKGRFFKYLRAKIASRIIFTLKSRVIASDPPSYLGYIYTNIAWNVLEKLYIEEGMDAVLNRYSEYYNTVARKARTAIEGYIKDLDTQEEQYINQILEQNEN
jgi:hypothetical protein